MRPKPYSTTLSMTIMLLAAFIIAAMSAHAYISPNPSLNASVLYYTPVPATAGSIIDVYIKIYNNGASSGDVTVEFIDNDPFSIGSESDRVRSTGTIPSSESFLLKYQVRVGKDALPGTNYIKISYGLKSSSMRQTALLPIDVESASSSLSVESVELTPATFEPGNPGTVAITVRNTAGLKIVSGSVKLDITNIDLAPIGGTNQQSFTDLQSDETRTFFFKLAPSPSIVPGVYKVPVVIAFKDQQGVEYSAAEYTGIPVGVEPELSVYFDSTSVSSDTKSGEVVVKFVNKGLSEIKFLELKVLQNDDVSVLSESDVVYVGNIAQDDYETAEIRLQVKKSPVDIPLRVTYRDALNREYSQTATLSLSTKEAAGDGKLSGTTWLVLLVLIPIAWWAYRRWGAKRK